MKISGLTIIRNAELMDYPIVESIKSLLPIVDEYIVCVGSGDDNTRGLIEKIESDKIKIIDTVWDTSNNSGGRILSKKTNEAISYCTGDWCFYLQADEILHEKDRELLLSDMKKYLSDESVEALTLNFVHFYGSYDIISTARNWYRKEVRIIKKDADVKSVKDAQGFRVGKRKPYSKHSSGIIYHYGWVKCAQKMKERLDQQSFWWKEKDMGTGCRMIYGLRRFVGAHPTVMAKRIREQNWDFKPKYCPRDWQFRDYRNLVSAFIEKVTGQRIRENKNYILVK